MKLYNLKLIAFCKMFDLEMREIMQHENLALAEARVKNPEFSKWYDLIQLVQDVVMQYENLDDKRLKGVCDDLARVGKQVNDILCKEQVEYYPSVLYFNMLQNCKFSNLHSDNGAIDKLKEFDLKSLYPLIDKYNLRNNFKFLRASLLFKKRYWENYE